MDKIIRRSNIQLICGQAKPGASLAFLKNMAIFCREFNEKTRGYGSHPVNVEIIVYADKSYSYSIKNVPSSFLIKEKIKGKDSIKKEELKEIAEKLSSSLNTENNENALKIISGTVKSFGVKIID